MMADLEQLEIAAHRSRDVDLHVRRGVTRE